MVGAVWKEFAIDYISKFIEPALDFHVATKTLIAGALSGSPTVPTNFQSNCHGQNLAWLMQIMQNRSVAV